MAFQVAQLLTRDDDVPGHVRSAIDEGRLEDAGLMLMDTFELTCEEAGELVDLSLCGDEPPAPGPSADNDPAPQDRLC